MNLGFVLIVFGIFISPLVFITTGLILLFKKELSAKTNINLTQLLWFFSVPLLIITGLMKQELSKMLYALPIIGALSLVVLNKESLKRYRKYYGGLLILSAIVGAIAIYTSFYIR